VSQPRNQIRNAGQEDVESDYLFANIAASGSVSVLPTTRLTMSPARTGRGPQMVIASSPFGRTRRHSSRIPPCKSVTKNIPKTQRTASNVSIRKRQAFEVSPPKLYICETLFRSALGSFIQELFGEIESDHFSGGRDAFGLASVCQLPKL